MLSQKSAESQSLIVVQLVGEISCLCLHCYTAVAKTIFNNEYVHIMAVRIWLLHVVDSLAIDAFDKFRFD